jgi:hypothetical protein
VIDLVYEPKECLVTFVERRRLHIGQDAGYEVMIFEKFASNCGVGFQSKRTMIPLRRVGSNQLAQPGAERSRPAKNFLGEPCEMFRRARKVREQVPDLRVLGTLLLHLFDEGTVWARLRVALDLGQEHGLHGLSASSERTVPSIVPRLPSRPKTGSKYR